MSHLNCKSRLHGGPLAGFASAIPLVEALCWMYFVIP